MQVDFPEDERQAVVLALARLALERPGWKPYLKQIAERMDPGAVLFSAFHTETRPSLQQVRTLLIEVAAKAAEAAVAPDIEAAKLGTAACHAEICRTIGYVDAIIAGAMVVVASDAPSPQG